MGATATKNDFENKSGLDFTDISSEAWREYSFDNGEIIKINHPLQLHVNDDGHRIFDSEGISHYIPAKWIHLRWKAKEGEPNFVR